MAIRFDRSYWPKTGTQIERLPVDLMDLWDKFPDQASIFVAEALIADEEPLASVFLADASYFEVFLWSVGGDTLSMTFDLVDALDAATRDYYHEVVSDEQAEDVSRQIVGLEKLATAVAGGKQHLQELLDQYQKVRGRGR